jgi:uncharacterized membrane protein
MANSTKINPNIFLRMDAHHRLMVSLAICAIVLFFIVGRFSTPATVLITWMSFAFSVNVMCWISIMNSHPREVRKIAKLQDSSRAMIFGLVIFASLISMVAVVFLLKLAKGQSSAIVTGHIVLSIGAVIISWWLVHTIFALRYAHIYYDTDTDDGQPRKGGGLDFPNTQEPDYLDFVYFSFVVGMTFQVSDVVITDRYVRRLCLMHALISFAFNTAIVALSINVISGMVSS